MTDTQVLTIIISIVIPLSVLIYSNSRITDAKETLRAESNLGFERISRQIEQLRTEIKLDLEKLDRKLEKHELEHHS